jgi:hypothetical protein
MGGEAEKMSEECDDCWHEDFCELHGFCFHDLDITESVQDEAS